MSRGRTAAGLAQGVDIYGPIPLATATYVVKIVGSPSTPRTKHGLEPLHSFQPLFFSILGGLFRFDEGRCAGFSAATDSPLVLTLACAVNSRVCDRARKVGWTLSQHGRLRCLGCAGLVNLVLLSVYGVHRPVGGSWVWLLWCVLSLLLGRGVGIIISVGSLRGSSWWCGWG